MRTVKDLENALRPMFHKRLSWSRRDPGYLNAVCGITILEDQQRPILDFCPDCYPDPVCEIPCYPGVFE